MCIIRRVECREGHSKLLVHVHFLLIVTLLLIYLRTQVVNCDWRKYSALIALSLSCNRPHLLYSNDRPKDYWTDY